VVYDVQPKLGARVRLLDTESTNKNDPHDARSVAIAALRSKKPNQVQAEDHAAVAKLWSKRHRDLARNVNKVACRLHSLLCDLVAGGVPEEMTVTKAAQLQAKVRPAGVAAARVELAQELLEDLRRLNVQMKESKKRLAAVVAAARTSVIKVFGVGPVNGAAVIGLAGDVARFPNRAHFAAFNGTAPIDVSSGGKKIFRLSLRGNRYLNNAIHMAAIVQIRHRTSPGRAYYDRKVAEGKTHKEALRCLKRRVSDAIYDRLVEDARRAGRPVPEGPGGQAGNDSVSSATGSRPRNTGSSDEPLPDPPQPYVPSRTEASEAGSGEDEINHLHRRGGEESRSKSFLTYKEDSLLSASCSSSHLPRRSSRTARSVFHVDFTAARGSRELGLWRPSRDGRLSGRRSCPPCLPGHGRAPGRGTGRCPASRR